MAFTVIAEVYRGWTIQQHMDASDAVISFTAIKNGKRIYHNGYSLEAIRRKIRAAEQANQ